MSYRSLSLAFVAALGLVPAGSAHAQRIPEGAIELFDYTVQAGDTCASISQRFFGNRRRYDIIHAYNPNMGPPPHDLQPGTVLRLPREAPSAASMADATVTGVERRVDARPRPADEDWQSARRGLGLYRGGRVQTQQASAAELTFRDTSVVQLREQTLVIIFGTTSTATRRAGMEATLETGALRTRLGQLRGGDSSGGNRLTVTTSSSTTDLEGGSSVVSVNTQGTSAVSNHSSRARVRGRSGRAVELPENTGSVVRAGEAPTPPRPLPAAPGWEAGGSSRFVAIAGRGATVHGAWTAVPSVARYHVELARSADGRDVVIVTDVPADVTRFEAQRVPAGRYYVFVSAMDADGLEGRESEAFPIEVVEARVLAPGDDGSGPAPVLDPESPAATGPLRVLEGTVIVAPEGGTCDGQPRALLTASTTCTVADQPVSLPPLEVVAWRSEVEGDLPLRVTGGTTSTAYVRLAPAGEADFGAPEDLELQASDGLRIQDFVREGDRYRLTISGDEDLESGTLRWVSRATPDRTLATMAVEVTPPAQPNEPVHCALECEYGSLGPAGCACAPPPDGPWMTDAFARMPMASSLSLTDFERRGSQIALGFNEFAPHRGASRSRIALAADVSLLDDTIQLGAAMPYDFVGAHDSTWQRGSLDVYGHARLVLARRIGARRLSAGFALDVGAWFPTHPTEPSGLRNVRLTPSAELSVAVDRGFTFRTRQGAVVEVSDTGSRLWASAYGLDLEVLDLSVGAFSLGVELDMVLGTEDMRSVFALGVAPQLGINLDPVHLGVGMRFGLNRDGQSFFGPATLGVTASIAFR